MKHCLVLILAASLFSGCVNPAQTYVTQHPELSPKHRSILLAGKIGDGTSVAGMTKYQVRLAMRTDPDQFTTFNGMEAWVYFRGSGGGAPGEGGHHHGGHSGSPALADDSTSPGGYSASRGGPVSNMDRPIGSGDASAAEKKGAHTTILFVGDHAVRADVSRQ